MVVSEYSRQAVAPCVRVRIFAVYTGRVSTSLLRFQSYAALD